MTFVGTFYYPWTGGNSSISPSPNTWYHWIMDGHNPPLTWASQYLPDISPTTAFDPNIRLYSSKDSNIVFKQLALMKQSNIDFIISSWWGQKGTTDGYADEVLDYIVHNVLTSPNNPYPNIKFTIYYELAALADNYPKAQIISDINYIKAKYANSPYFFKINGKPVIFVFNRNGVPNGLNQATTWSQVRSETGIYTVLRIFSGWETHADLANSWHIYDPTINYTQVTTYSASISPGFYRYHPGTPYYFLARDINQFTNDVKTLQSTNVQFKLIETWNEYGEGTQIEPAQPINHDDIYGFTAKAQSYKTLYVDILNTYNLHGICPTLIVHVK